MDLNALTQTSGAWLRGSGPDSDIVISSRIRLARNLARYPFPIRADQKVKAEIESVIRAQIDNVRSAGAIDYIDVNSLCALDRQFLVERQIISREHAETQGSRGVGVGAHESLSLMINEEDHLRMQVLGSGMAVDACWEQINQLDDELEAGLVYAFSEQFGYLTSCPTNVGTGIRVSVMLHLPALVLTREIQKLFQALPKIGLAVRGLYGEGSQALGDFYQISNQTTLGRSERQIIEDLKGQVPHFLDYERKAREKLINEDRSRLHDHVCRAFGILKSAHQINSQETMQLLSTVRMGINLGLVSGLEIPTVNELFIHIQPAHLQKLKRESLESSERNVARAAYLRARLANGSSPN